MSQPSGWLLADIGNSRVKLVWLGGAASSVARLFDLNAEKLWDERLTLQTATLEDQTHALAAWLEPKQIMGIWICSVSPSATAQLMKMLDTIVETRQEADIEGCLVSSAADVGVANRLDSPVKTGADRALAVRAALRLMDNAGPGIVVMCGTAMTVERVDSDGIWMGGAIAPGYRLGAQALQQGTAALVMVDSVTSAPLAHGSETVTAIQAGLFWGQVGAARELIRRNTGDYPFWEIWTGGDASLLARWAGGDQARIVPDLVLRGLADLALNQQQTMDSSQ